MTTSTYQQDKKATSRHRAVANQGASRATAHFAVSSIQRKGTDDEELQLKSITQLATPEEDELQMKSAGEPKNNPVGEVSQRKDNASLPGANKTGIPDHLKTGIENLSGISLDDVKVHYNSDKPAQLNALAYAQGTDIHVAPGQERHLPHEAWHVVQQKQGRVRPTIQAKGVAINDDRGLEHEADVMGNEALLFKSIIPKALTAQPKTTTIFQCIARWYEKVNEHEYQERWVGLPSFTGCQKLEEQYNGKDVYVNGGIRSPYKDETFGQWAWRNKWWLIAAGIIIGGTIAYTIYRREGGTGAQVPIETSKLSTPSVEVPTPSVETATPSIEAPTPSIEASTPSVEAPTPLVETSTLSVETPTPSVETATPSIETTKHAWPLGKSYGPIDKVKGLVSLAPGGSLVVEGLEQIVKGKADGPALIAEVIKLHPYAWPANVYDQVAVVLSYYSSGKYEIGQTKDLIEQIFQSASKAK